MPRAKLTTPNNFVQRAEQTPTSCALWSSNPMDTVMKDESQMNTKILRDRVSQSACLLLMGAAVFTLDLDFTEFRAGVMGTAQAEISDVRKRLQMLRNAP